MANVQEVVGVALIAASFASGVPVWGVIALRVAGSVVFGAGAQRAAKEAAEAKARAAAAAANAAFLSGLKDRLATSIGSEQYHRTLYGLNKVGGNIVAMFPSGAHDEFKTCVVVFANHEINAYTKFYVAGKYVGNLDGSGWVTGGAFFDSSLGSTSTSFTTTIELPTSYVPGSVNVYYNNSDSSVSSNPIAYTLTGTTLTVATGVKATVSYQYTSITAAQEVAEYAATGISKGARLRIIQHKGIAGEAADSYLTSTFPSRWTSAHTLEGHAYCVFVLDLRQSEFQGGPPTFQAEIQGKKLYDPRTGSTAYSDNNALVLLDYLTGPYMRTPLSVLPIADYIAAANDCDDVVRSGAVAPQSNKRYTFNGVISSNESPKKVLEQIAQSMCGIIEGNSWSVYVGKYRAPVMTLLQEDVVGGITIIPGLGYQGTYNTVRGQYVCPSNDYVATDFPPYINQAYLTADGQEIFTDAQVPYTNNVTGIYSIERIKMEDARNGLTLTGDFSYKTWNLRPGDRVTFTSELLGMSAKVFRVTDKTVKFGSAVHLSLKEDASSIWDQLDSTIVDATPNTSLSDPWTIPLLAGLTAFSGTSALLRAASGEVISRILLTWQPANYQGTAAVDIEWRRHVSNTWESLVSAANNSGTYLTGVIDGEGYVIRARMRSLNLGAVGPWAYVDHTVVGKSEPPPDVASLTVSGRVLTWPPVSTPDLAGYVLAFHYGTNYDWGSAAPLNSGFITESPYALPSALAGLVTVMVKAIDTTGNVSTGAALATTLLDAPVLSNIVQLYDYGNAGYPGTIVNGTVSTTTIIANASDSFYGSDASSFYGSDLDSLYTAAGAAYASVVYTTPELFVTSALAGSKLSLAISTANTEGLLIEYRGVDLTSKYGTSDSDSFYGSDADSFYADGAPVWYPWPGQLTAKNTVYQFRVTLGTNTGVQPTLQSLVAIVDAPTITEQVNNLTVNSSGTVIPYTSSFTSITNVQATLQANGVGGVTVEVDKTNLTVKVYNSSHTAVSGAAVDITLRGY